MDTLSNPVTVAVPATSANLGPGFDTLGLALDLEDELRVRRTRTGFSVRVTGEGAGEVSTGEEHLVIRALLASFDRAGAPRPTGVELACHNRIPHARGLGSSSAAIVGGILLARGLGVPLDDDAALRLAAEIEGHPDNVAPCLLGGFTIAWTGSSGARAVRRLPAPDLRPVIFIPPVRGLTAQARAALPEIVPHADAAFTAARAALLVHALTTDLTLLLEATADRLHQPYRAPAMPETAELVAALRARGIAAVVSGAGPSVLALTVADQDPGPAPDGWCARSLSVCLPGARILVSRHAEGDPVAAGPPS